MAAIFSMSRPHVFVDPDTHFVFVEDERGVVTPPKTCSVCTRKGVTVFPFKNIYCMNEIQPRCRKCWIEGWLEDDDGEGAFQKRFPEYCASRWHRNE